MTTIPIEGALALAGAVAWLIVSVWSLKASEPTREGLAAGSLSGRNDLPRRAA